MGQSANSHGGSKERSHLCDETSLKRTNLTSSKIAGFLKIVTLKIRPKACIYKEFIDLFAVCQRGAK